MEQLFFAPESNRLLVALSKDWEINAPCCVEGAPTVSEDMALLTLYWGKDTVGLLANQTSQMPSYLITVKFYIQD